MWICDKCGEVFDEPKIVGCPSEPEHSECCPGCGNEYFDEAVRCRGCGDMISINDAYGYSHRLFCKECLYERKGDIDFLVKATSDCEDVEVPILYKYIFTDEDINAILYHAAKEKLSYGDIYTQDFIDDYANDVAEALDTEMGDD